MASSSPPTAIAVLDDYADVATKHFSKIPNVRVVEFSETLNTAEHLDAQVKRLEPYPIISSMRERTAFPGALLERLPNLRLLLNAGTRNASIDLIAAKQLGIIVTGTKGDTPTDPSQLHDLESLGERPPAPGHSTVIQVAYAQLLALLSRVPKDDCALRSDPEYWQGGLISHISGKTLGVLGLGKLGLGMAKVGISAWGMKVVAWSENLSQAKADEATEAAGLGRGVVRVVGREELFGESDVLSLHVVLSERTRGIVGAEELGMMKRSAVIVNTSRGPLVDEAALIQVLKEGRIRGACLDVFDEEPLPRESEWRRSGEWKGEVVMSPHMGYVSVWQMNRWYQEQAECVGQFLNGEEVGRRMG